MNQNCQVDRDSKDGGKSETDPTKPETFGIPDWQYKWNVFQSQQGKRK